MSKIVLASSNKHKLEEFQSILDYDIVPLSATGFNEEIEEIGTTFLENAVIKARTVAESLNRVVLSDDSGLRCSALDGAPGVFSARYAGANQDDRKNCEKLLRALSQKNDRRAKFVSVVVLYMPEGWYYFGLGETYGKIVDEFKGNGGFGYDPIFYSDELNKTFGEATAEEKNAVSHRFRAICDLKNKIGGKLKI